MREFSRFLAGLALFAYPALAAGGASSFGSLSGAISVRVSGKQRVLEYCPDNTCERFSAPSRVSEATLSEFAFLYLASASTYTGLEPFRSREAPPRVASIVAAHSAACPGRQQPQLTACVLLTLQKASGIQVHFVRHDEGVEAVTPVSLEAALRSRGSL
jgi:hypothetical protein